jgi:hypothetical protein
MHVRMHGTSITCTWYVWVVQFSIFVVYIMAQQVWMDKLVERVRTSVPHKFVWNNIMTCF